MSLLDTFTNAISGMFSAEDGERCEQSLAEFVRQAWPIIDPGNPLVWGPSMDAICEHLEAVQDGYITRLLMTVPPGFSKPVSDQTLVQMADGTRKLLSAVAVGEAVITKTGRVGIVDAVHVQGRLPCVKICTWSGREIVAGVDHPFLTPEGWVEAGRLSTEQCLALRTSRDCVSRDVGRTDEEFVLAGYFIGDGSCTQGAANITSGTDIHCEQVLAVVAKLGFVANVRMRKANINVVRIELSRGIRPWMRDIGIAGVTSYTKRVPQFVFGGTDHQVAQFIAAYFQCDGMVTKKAADRKRFIISFSSVSRELLGDLQSLLLRLGINSRVRKRVAKSDGMAHKAGYVSWTLDISKEDEGAKFFQRIPLIGPKHERLRGHRHFRSSFGDPEFLADPIVSVEHLRDLVSCRCLTIRGGDLFIAGDFVVHNSTITNVCFPAWSWARQPHLRFICTSYSEGLTRHNNNRCRHIILDGWYQAAWGKKYMLQAPNRPDLMSNDHLGWILATSVGGQLLGWRGDRVILDDPNSPQVESQAVRLTTNRWFQEVVPSRLNDMAKSAIVVIQQRMHMEDVVGTALGSDVPWVHCNIPMEYEPRAYVNGWRAGSAMIESFFDDEVDECSELFWADWRTEDGELAWPARFPVSTLVQMKASMGPTAIAAQLQQHPIPRGGAIIKRDWWQSWPTNDPFPPLSYIVAALDTAYTADTSNDPSAMTIWGVNKDEYDNPRLFLLWAWQEWLELHDLVEKIIDICQVDKRPVTGPRFPVDRLLIEDATVGKSVNQELDRILRQRMTFGIDLCNPRNYGGDKTARMYSIEHVFSQKMVYAHERSWSEKVIDQCASVPYTSDDHLADTVAMAIRWLRDCGYAPKKEEVAEEYLSLRTFKPRMRPLYPGNSAR